MKDQLGADLMYSRKIDGGEASAGVGRDTSPPHDRRRTRGTHRQSGMDLLDARGAAVDGSSVGPPPLGRPAIGLERLFPRLESTAANRNSPCAILNSRSSANLVGYQLTRR